MLVIYCLRVSKKENCMTLKSLKQHRRELVLCWCHSLPALKEN